MRVAILESIVMPAGHEVEFDRILVDELRQQGHKPIMFVPEKFPFKVTYDADVTYLDGGEAISYAGVGRLKKLYLSLLREKRRRAWFNSAYERASRGECDAIIIPTGTYRYIKTILRSRLKYAPVPVYIIFHGINPKEQPKFEKQARKVAAYSNIHLKVITLRNDFVGKGLTNVSLMPPPVFTPAHRTGIRNSTVTPPITLGFFGQFRKEKNLPLLLEAFCNTSFTVPVRLIVQGATAKPEDGALFDQIAKDYGKYKNIEFWHRNLIGEEWNDALLSVDALLIPYAAERYRYHWGAMLFTAIGFYKPVLVSPELNPEVLERFHIGETIAMDSVDALGKDLKNFVERLTNQENLYGKELERANAEFSASRLITNILGPYTVL